MNRRDFLKVLAVTPVVAAASSKAEAVEGTEYPEELRGILVDTTRCVGCRNCEIACAEANNLPYPDLSEMVPNKPMDTNPNQYMVINLFETDKGESWVRHACMHCVEPACATVCPVKALEKLPEGPVIWHPDRCMGCRYCMMSCPFDIPKFEYDSYNPKIQKCFMCWHRQEKGEDPACVDACPQEALMFGTRRELLQEAHARLAEHPDEYIQHIYGEYEVGGTGILYLSNVPFEQLGFRTDLGNTPYTEYSKEFLYAVPMVLTILPALLMGIATATHRNDSKETNAQG